jgi:hypothetical protein
MAKQKKRKDPCVKIVPTKRQLRGWLRKVDCVTDYYAAIRTDTSEKGVLFIDPDSVSTDQWGALEKAWAWDKIHGVTEQKDYQFPVVAAAKCRFIATSWTTEPKKSLVDGRYMKITIPLSVRGKKIE